MKQFKFIIGFLVGSVLFGTIGVYAGGNREEIKAILNHELTIDINNEIWQPMNSNGDVLAPIMYEKRTYVPLRAFAERLNYSINYRETTEYDNEGIDINLFDYYSEPFFLNSFQSKMSFEDLNKILGKPIKTESIDYFNKGDYGHRVTYNNGDIIDYNEDNSAIFVTIKSPLIKTARGIRVGSKLEDVKEKYGNPSTISNASNTEFTYLYGEGYSLYFLFVNNIVVKMGTSGSYDYDG